MRSVFLISFLAKQTQIANLTISYLVYIYIYIALSRYAPITLHCLSLQQED